MRRNISPTLLVVVALATIAFLPGGLLQLPDSGAQNQSVLSGNITDKTDATLVTESATNLTSTVVPIADSAVTNPVTTDTATSSSSNATDTPTTEPPTTTATNSTSISTTTTPTPNTTNPTTNAITTTTLTPPTPSQPTSPATQPPSPPGGRRFDAPSFFGGIILAFGLIAIGYVAFKFYKARTEHNYHSL